MTVTSKQTTQRTDSELLSGCFFQTLDSSRVAHLARSLLKDGEHPQLQMTGEGTFFSTFRLENGQMPLALKVLKGDWADSIALQDIRTATRRFIELEHPLVPPAECLSIAATMIIVMPFGEAAGKLHDHWLPLQDTLRGFDRFLESRNFVNLDAPDIRSWNGIPFIADTSDIVLAKKSHLANLRI